jgi:hypothetical protein
VRWQFDTGRAFLSADRACREQRMNAPGLVRDLGDPQVQDRAGSASAAALPIAAFRSRLKPKVT